MLSAVNDLYSPVLPVPSEMQGVFLGEEGSADELPGVEAHDVAVIPKPTGVDLGGSQPEPPQVEAAFDNAAFDTAVDGGPKQQDVAEINQVVPPKVGMAARNAHIRNPPKQYVSSMQGNKYQVTLAQITTSPVTSETSIAFAQMSVKLMSKGIYQRVDIVGMVMAQVSLKAATFLHCSAVRDFQCMGLKEFHQWSCFISLPTDSSASLPHFLSATFSST